MKTTWVERFVWVIVAAIMAFGLGAYAQAATSRTQAISEGSFHLLHWDKEADVAVWCDPRRMMLVYTKGQGIAVTPAVTVGCP